MTSQGMCIQQFIPNSISETSTNHVSNEVLEVIHLFLEEFIDLLMKSANSLDISHLKAITLELLSQNLGKQLLVEAEIALLRQQQQRESENTTTYSEAFYIQQLALKKAFEKYRVLEPLTEEENQDNNHVEISPIVVIYVTSVVEHLAEYILNLVVAGGDAEDIGIKEVFDVLLEDRQLTYLFQQMSLKGKLERRIGIAIPTPLPSPVSLKKNQFIMRSLSVFSIATRKDDPEISFHADDHRPRTSSIKSSESIQDRPLSATTSTTITNTNTTSTIMTATTATTTTTTTTTTKPSPSKSRFHFFKEKRNSISLSFSKKSNPSSPTTPINTDFDDLIRSGNTKKVSLTPNRLRSIEIKEGSHSELTSSLAAPPTPTTIVSWEKKLSTPIKGGRTTTATKKKTSRVPPPPPLPVPPLPRMNGPSPPLTPASSISSYSYQKSKQDELNAGSEMILLDMQTSSSPRTSAMTNTSSLDTIISPTSDADLNITKQQHKYKNTNTAGSVNVLLPVIIKKSVSTTTEETDEEEDSLFSSNMIYALPEISQTYITNVSKEDKGCQTDPFFNTEDEEEEEVKGCDWSVEVWNKNTQEKQWLITNV